MPAQDNTSYSGSIDSPALHAVAVSPSDGATLAYVSRALWIGTAGNIAVDMQGGETNVIFTNISGWLPGRVTKVYNTGTTASGITAVW